MTRPAPADRPDLVDALLQSCWLVETARARVFERWGPDFAEQAERTGKRADLVAAAVAASGLEPAASFAAGHTDWMSSLVGESPDTVPLGPALLQRLGEWTNVYIVDYLPSDPADFLALGESELLFPVPPRTLEEAEAYIEDVDPGAGPRFVVLTDLHIGAKHTEGLLRLAVQEVNALEPEFVVIPGDVTDDGEPEQFARAKELLDGLRAPYHAVLGNHDAVRRSTTTGDGAEHFANAFGSKPVDTVLECGGVQVALVDSSDPTPSPFPDWDLGRGGFREDAGGTNGGAFDPGQAEALAGRIDPDRPVLVILHHELQPFTAFPPLMFGLRNTDSDALLDALSGHNLAGVVAGHTHRSALLPVGRGVPQLEVPALKDWPYCYTVISVADGRPRAAVRQIADREYVWKLSRSLPPIWQNYVTGPWTALDHTF